MGLTGLVGGEELSEVATKFGVCSDSPSPPTKQNLLLSDFSNGHSGGVGVIHSADLEIYDTASNQINGTGSAFYEADMRSIEKTYNDAYVEFYGLRSGMGAAPYVHWNSDPTPTELINFNKAWWSTANKEQPNRLHLIGIEDAKPSDSECAGGAPYIDGMVKGASYIYVRKIELKYPGDLTTQSLSNRNFSVHELTHNFSIEALSDGTYHCNNLAWPIPNESPQHGCAMNPAVAPYTSPRFCEHHLLTGDGSITDVHVSIRMQEDPLPY